MGFMQTMNRGLNFRLGLWLGEVRLRLLLRASIRVVTGVRVRFCLGVRVRTGVMAGTRVGVKIIDEA